MFTSEPYSNLIKGKVASVKQRFTTDTNNISITVPSACKQGFLIVEAYGYNSSAKMTIKITDSSGISASSQLLDTFGKDLAQSAPMSIWFGTMNANKNITIQVYHPDYPTCTVIMAIVY